MGSRRNVQAFRETRKQEFCDLYPLTSNSLLAEQFGVSVGTILREARQLGLKKDPAYRIEVQRQNATGRILPEAARAKIAAARRGHSWTEEQRTKILKTRHERGPNRGERHYKWRGGRPWERFKNPQYLAWRKKEKPSHLNIVPKSLRVSWPA